MTNLPPIPKDRNWSPETWRAGLDEAVRRCEFPKTKTWASLINCGLERSMQATIAHATTLLDAGIVKPVVSEATVFWRKAYTAYISSDIFNNGHEDAAIAVIQSALDKARAGE